MKFFTAPKIRMYLKQKLHLKLGFQLNLKRHICRIKSVPATKIAPNDINITIAGQIIKKNAGKSTMVKLRTLFFFIFSQHKYTIESWYFCIPESKTPQST